MFSLIRTAPPASTITSRSTSAKDGAAEGEFHLALNDPAGTWKLFAGDTVAAVNLAIAADTPVASHAMTAGQGKDKLAAVLNELVRYTVVDDYGRLINPLLTEGQVVGGVAQGIGQALLEHTVFDPESGQLLSGSLMDYALPRADDLPMFDVSLIERPTGANPLGVKGSGQAGAIAAPQTVMAAVRDALASAGVTEIDMPATPERVWLALQQAGSTR